MAGLHGEEGEESGVMTRANDNDTLLHQVQRFIYLFLWIRGIFLSLF